MNDYKFGNFLCFLRESKGLTQAQIAETLKVTPAAVSKWENGESKPRTETLFQLATILGVRVEELMAGEYIPIETLNQEKVNEIYKKYEYLQKTDSYATASVKVRRCVAWAIDWNLSFLLSSVFLFLYFFIIAFIKNKPTPETMAATTLLIMIISAMSIFTLRDLIFGKRSIGKRIMGLTILDGETGEKAKKSQCVIRNLFIFLYQFDLIFMLIKGQSIGDKVAHTIVVSKKAYENNEKISDSQKADAINSYNDK